MCWRCYQRGKAWGKNLTPQLPSWWCQEDTPVNLGATLSQCWEESLLNPMDRASSPQAVKGPRVGVWPWIAPHRRVLSCCQTVIWSESQGMLLSQDLLAKQRWQKRLREGKKKGSLKLQSHKICFKSFQHRALVLELRRFQRWLTIAKDKY